MVSQAKIISDLGPFGLEVVADLADTSPMATNTKQAYVAIGNTGEIVAFTPADNRVDAARWFRRQGIKFVTVQKV